MVLLFFPLDVTPLNTALEYSETQLKRLALLHQIDQAITSGAGLSAVTSTILGHFTNALDVDAADILLLDLPSLLLKKVSARGLKLHIKRKPDDEDWGRDRR